MYVCLPPMLSINILSKHSKNCGNMCTLCDFENLKRLTTEDSHKQQNDNERLHKTIRITSKGFPTKYVPFAKIAEQLVASAYKHLVSHCGAWRLTGTTGGLDGAACCRSR